MKWIESDFINKNEVARAIGMSADLFSKKRNGIQKNKFTPQNLADLEKVRNQIATILEH